MIDIGYRFKDEGLLRRALTHSSAVGGRGPHNEKLEFLGDSVLDLYAASKLLALMEDAREGTLAHRREQIVCERWMSVIARRAGVDKALVVGGSVKEISPRMLADAMEAVIAAVYLDGGMAAVKQVDAKLGIVR